MGYTKKAIKGISWLGLFRLIFRALTFLKLAVIARLLTPSQFGQADIALIVLAMIEIFTETGINVFLVQKTENIDEFIDTAWVVSIMRGLLMTIIIIICAVPVSVFFNSAGSLNLLFIVSLIPLVRGFINPSVVKLLKDLDYHKHFFYRSSISFVEVLFTVLITLSISNPLGIVYGLLIGAIWEVFISMIIASPKPHFSFDLNKFKQIFKVGKWLTLSGIFDYFYLNSDNIFIGRMLGTGSLGYYMRAYSISLIPITEISDVINQSTFPIYVKIAGNKMRLMNAYFKTLFIVSMLVIPSSIFIYIFAEYLVILILGASWAAIVPVLRVLIIYGCLRAIIRTTIGLFYSLKRQDIITRITFVSLLLMLITIVPLINNWGIIGAAVSAIIGTLGSIPVAVYYIIRLFRDN